MNSRNTWIWITVAAALFGLIFFLEYFKEKPVSGPARVLPEFKAAAVTVIQVQPAGESEIRAERTNITWRLTKPVAYPAQPTAIDGLLAALERLTPATQITVSEMRRHPNADAEFGFEPPQFTLIVQNPTERRQILIGGRTAPGDQVYLQVAAQGTYVVDADWLKLVPRKAENWRDFAFMDLRALEFDRIVISNAASVIEFQRAATNNLWAMTRPLTARADNAHLIDALRKLHSLRVTRFVTDNPTADLDQFGLQSPALQVTLAQGTNLLARMDFGKSTPTNANVIYARRPDIGSVVAVPKDSLLSWYDLPEKFRDRRLLTLAQPVDQIEIRGVDSFTLQRESTNAWRATSLDFPVDARWVNDFINKLCALPIVQFKDAITDPELPAFGLAPPSRQIIFRASAPASGGTNVVLSELSFGATNENTLYVRRTDENSVYAVNLADFQQLPLAAWQFRDRRIWSFTENDVVRLTVNDAGRKRQMARNGTNSWTLAAGSQGIINEFAIEDLANRYGEMKATLWVDRGEQNLTRYGFGTNSLSLQFELKNGDQHAVEIGDISPSGYPYAATRIEGQTWVFELELGLYQVLSYLAFPANVP